MIGLFITTILASAADSINPVAITQQFVLQGMVKKPKHIWFFIMATFFTNFTGGLLAYYGLLAVLTNVIDGVFTQIGEKIYIAECALGILLLIFVCYSILRQRNRKAKQVGELSDEIDSEDEEKLKVANKMKSVTPLSLTVLGIIATIAELSTALPYFAFLAVLLNHQLYIIELIIILLIYNLIYSSPLMLLYFVYRLKQDLFERLYIFMKRQMQKWSVVLLPLMLGLAGIAIIFHGIYSLIS
jgi:cytochrome c biogenesis protein CcdA